MNKVFSVRNIIVGAVIAVAGMFVWATFKAFKR